MCWINPTPCASPRAAAWSSARTATARTSTSGTNFLRCLTPAGTIATFARNDTPLDLHAYDDEIAKGTIGRSEWSGLSYSPDGQWLFAHLQYPGETFAITGPWEKGWL